MYGYTYKYEPTTGVHTVETAQGVFPAKRREDAFHLANIAERREMQRLALVRQGDRRSTYSSVMRNRRIWG